MSEPRTAGSDPFVDYYAAESLSETARQRFASVKQVLIAVLESRGLPTRELAVADIGCGAGTQAIMWARDGHRVQALDINESLLELGRQRAASAGVNIDFRAGSATALPWESRSVDVCIVPELLEHVADWKSVLDECTRIVKPSGVIFLSTTNALCPKQDEFDLPFYSWYPASLKRRYERLSVTTRPELVNHAKYPAVHWFTYFSLARAMSKHGFDSLDRFDLMWIRGTRGAARLVVGAIRALPPLRRLAHVATPYTVLVGMRRP